VTVVAVAVLILLGWFFDDGRLGGIELQPSAL